MNSSFLFYSFVIFFGIILNLSCSKEDDDTSSQPVRLKEIIHFQNGSEFKKFILRYEGLAITNIAGYMPSKSANSIWSQTEDMSVYYIENRIESVQSDYWDGEWYQQKVKVDLFTAQELVYRTYYYNYNPDLDDWVEDEKIEFHGDGTQLSSINYFKWEGGGWFQNRKSEYEYNSGALSVNKEYQWALTDWILTKDCSIHYNDNNIQEIFESRPNQGSEYRFVLSYIGNKLESIKKSLDVEGEWIGVETITFEYDQSGNLIKYESVHHQHQIVNLFEYSYELGGHNLSHYLQSESLFNYPFPLPYPVFLYL